MSEKSFPDSKRTIGALLRAPYQHLQKAVYADLARTGHGAIRPAHSAVFRHILANGSRVTELAERAGITKQSMAALVEHLEKHGYVQVMPDPNDGRAKRVVLTNQGKQVQREAARLSRMVEKTWAQAIGQKKMTQLHTLLSDLYDHLEGPGDDQESHST